MRRLVKQTKEKENIPVKAWIMLLFFLFSNCLSGMNNMYAGTSRLLFTAKCNGTGTADDGTVWTVTSDGKESTYASDKGICYKNSTTTSVSYINLQTSSIPGRINSVRVEACGNTDVLTRVSVRVGDTPFTALIGEKRRETVYLPNVPASVLFEGSGYGSISVSITQSASKSPIYCRGIEVEYEEGVEVGEGEEMVVSSARTIEQLQISSGGKVVLGEKRLRIAGDLVIATTPEAGQSGQITGANASNLSVDGDTYLDIHFGAFPRADRWHAFTVPFAVDASAGVYDPSGTPMVYGDDYAIMVYDGAARADGLYGWRKETGMLSPGTFYLMTIDGEHSVYRLKKSSGSLLATPEMSFVHYTGAGTTSDEGWNGLGNPTIEYRQTDEPIQVLDEAANVFQTQLGGETELIVGMPFFYQAAVNGVMELEQSSRLEIRAKDETSRPTYRKIRFGNGQYTDWIYVATPHDALNGSTTEEPYRIGLDLVKMTMTDTPSVPQISMQAKGTRLSMAYLPIAGKERICPLVLYAPQKGEYEIRAAAGQEELLLLKEGKIMASEEDGVWKLSLEKGENSGYGLMMLHNEDTTGWEETGVTGDGLRAKKMCVGGRIVILRGDALYGVMGEKIR